MRSGGYKDKDNLFCMAYFCFFPAISPMFKERSFERRKGSGERNQGSCKVTTPLDWSPHEPE